MRPIAPPFFFWKSRASTTCSRETLAILVRMRPMGRDLRSSIGGMPLGPIARGVDAEEIPAGGREADAPPGAAPDGGRADDGAEAEGGDAADDAGGGDEDGGLDAGA